jgi:hypothetical protein
MPYLPPTKETHLRLCEFLGDVNPAHLRGVDYYMSEDVVMLMSLGAPCPVAAQKKRPEKEEFSLWIRIHANFSCFPTKKTSFIIKTISVYAF